jgi:hypothetical protein
LRGAAVAKIVVEAVIATTHTVEGVYGPTALTEEALRGLADQVASGEVPFQAHHDARYRMDAEVLSVDVREMPDGELGVYASFEVDEEEWERAGPVGGMSFTTAEVVRRASPESDQPVIHLLADAYHFDDEVRAQAAQTLQTTFEVTESRLYQFAELPPPTVVVELLADLWSTGLPPAAIVSVLWKGLKLLLRPRGGGETTFTFRILGPRNQIDAHIKTGDERMLKTALESLEGLIAESDSESQAAYEVAYEYDEQDDEWQKG